MPVNRRFSLSQLLACLQQEFPRLSARHLPPPSVAETPPLSGSASPPQAATPLSRSASSARSAPSITNATGSDPADVTGTGHACGGNHPAGAAREVAEGSVSGPQRSRKGRHVFIEYVMLAGVNDR